MIDAKKKNVYIYIYIYIYIEREREREAMQIYFTKKKMQTLRRIRIKTASSEKGRRPKKKST